MYVREKAFLLALSRDSIVCFCCLSHVRACFKVLPRILCFNTMRYAFNMVTMMKEKVNTHFSFPLQLNMAPYTEDFLMGDQQDQGIETCNFVVLVLVVLNVLGSNLSTVVRALVSHQCGPCSDLCIDAICGLSLLLVLSFLPRGFSPGTPVFSSSQKPTFPNSNTTRSKETKNHSVDVLRLQILIYYLFHLANVDVGIVCQKRCS